MRLRTVVFDASTLVLLAKVDLLQIVAEKVNVVIPEQVKNEALAKPEIYDAQIIDGMLKDGRISISKEGHEVEIRKIREQFRIETGEAAALILAKEKKCTIGIDDGPGIQVAKILGVSFLTAIHVLIELYEQGLLNRQSALAKLESLEMLGRYNIQIMEEARSRIQKGR